MKTKSINLPRPGGARRILCLISLAAALSAGNLAAANVSFDITNLGQNLYRYNYTVSGIQFQVNQELDIRFDPAKYGTLSNGIAPAGFDLLLLQPNNPPGVFGDYSAMALVNNPSLSGTFSVDVRFLGSGAPGAQPFFINQLDAKGQLVSVLASGNSSGTAGSVPEPSGWTLAAAGLLICGVWQAMKRKLA